MGMVKISDEAHKRLLKLCESWTPKVKQGHLVDYLILNFKQKKGGK